MLLSLLICFHKRHLPLPCCWPWRLLLFLRRYQKSLLIDNRSFQVEALNWPLVCMPKKRFHKLIYVYSCYEASHGMEVWRITLACFTDSTRAPSSLTCLFPNSSKQKDKLWNFCYCFSHFNDALAPKTLAWLDSFNYNWAANKGKAECSIWPFEDFCPTLNLLFIEFALQFYTRHMPFLIHC